MIDKLIMQSTVNVTNVVQFLGSQWEFQPEAFSQDETELGSLSNCN